MNEQREREWGDRGVKGEGRRVGREREWGGRENGEGERMGMNEQREREWGGRGVKGEG